MNPPKDTHATGLVLRGWKAELAEKSQVRDHLAAEIDAWPDGRGAELNRLVEKYIIVRHRCEELEAGIERLSGAGPIWRSRRRRRR